MNKFLKENNYIYYRNYCLKNELTILSNETCKYYVLISNYTELYKLIDYLKKTNQKYMIIGNGSKLVFVNNYRGVIISLKKLKKIRIINELEVEVEAGLLLSEFINFLMINNLKGIESLIGIPSSIGGGLINNISAHGVHLSDFLISVLVYKDNEIIELKKEEIIFKYRYSSLKDNFIILKATFHFEKGLKEEMTKNLKKALEYRKSKQVIIYPNIGSIFKNGILPASTILKDAKVENFKYRNVSLSSKHLNFINIVGKVKGINIYRFVKKIKKRVYKSKKISLESEIIFVK